MNTEAIGLEFPGNEADEGEGLSESGIETYRNAPYVSTARECGQNSADVRASSEPVRVSFDLIEISLDDLPSAKQYRMAVELCLKKAKRNGKEKETTFFSRAKTILAAETIRVLRISDFGTTGAKGPATEGKPWHSLVKSNAVSDKADATAGGSFGIGKSAVFTISQLQTVFYSTIYMEAGKKKFLAQGKTRFTSHENQNGLKKKATGYWGQVSGFRPVDDKNMVPEWLRRDKPGTSVYAVACSEIPDWKERMSYSLVSNFFCAIDRKDLEFTLNSSATVIDDTSIDELLKDSAVEKAAENLNDTETLELTRSFYACLKSRDSIDRELRIPSIGGFSLKILVMDGLQKRIAFIRNGMYITDNLNFFGQHFQRFPMYRDFVAIVEPTTEKAIRILRELEDPEHKNFSPARIADEKRRAAIDKGMKELGKQIREAIKAEAVAEHESQTSIDELSEFFAMDDEQKPLPDANSEDNIESMKYEAKKPTRKKPGISTHSKGDTGGAGGSGGKTSGQGTGSGSGSGSGEGGTGDRGQARQIPLDDTRNLIVPGSNNTKRKLFLTPLESGDIRILVRAFGLSESVDLRVTGTTKGGTDRGAVILTAVNSGKRMNFEVQLEVPYAGPIEITAVSDEARISS